VIAALAGNCVPIMNPDATLAIMSTLRTIDVKDLGERRERTLIGEICVE
jgi:hypothetical protein